MRAARIVRIMIALAAIGAMRGPETARAQDPAQDATCASLTRAGLASYQALEYEAARQSLLAATQRVCGTSELVVIHVTLARIAVAQGRETEARDEMKQALRLDPYLVLDPLTSPKVLAALNQAREEISDELVERPPAKPDTPTAAGVSVRENASGREKAGWAFVGAGIASLTTSAAFFTLARVENEKQRDAADREDWQERDTHWGRTNAYANAGWIGAGLGAVAMGTGGILLWGGDGASDKNSPSAMRTRSKTPALALGPCGVSVLMNF
ncbi:MAG: hypothetical protein IT350_05695 [Deltaproteobacteria bacterium]|nr:hypothetical protein [Deltaproteobacteria bacterium]